jgi:hypothetical protein
MSEANPFLLLLLDFTNRLNRKTALESSLRDSIEFEQSENLGSFPQVFLGFGLLMLLRAFKCF